MNGFEIWRDGAGRLWARATVDRLAREHRDVTEHHNVFDEDDDRATPLRLVKPDPPAEQEHEEGRGA